MDFWYDLIDWLGGYPYDYAREESVVDFVEPLGFEVERAVRPAGWTGCGQFVFTRPRSPTNLGLAVCGQMPAIRRRR
jgi:hypothetical protein